MKFSYSWLKEFIPITLSPEALSERLTVSGFEVDDMTYIAYELSNVITARIDDISPHPDADKLVITKIFDGNNYHQVVTGAKNIKEGDIVPLSLPGAVLANGLKIKKSKLRGVESNGMLCSETELGVSDESDGIWILDPDTALGLDFIDYAKLRDVIYDISILPNRGDCQSIFGLARDLAAIFDLPLKLPEVRLKTTPGRVPLTVDSIASELCPLYTLRHVKNVAQRKTPFWMARRLQLLGIRPISLIVDITNYVLLELGQPLHAFDETKIEGTSIHARSARKNEKITTLDGEQRVLEESMLVISDTNKALAVAGVMGAQNSDISEDSTELYLEAAWFLPSNIRRTQIKLGLRTESAVRFEKGLDYDGVQLASDRAAFLMQELAEATVIDHVAVAEYESDFAKASSCTLEFEDVKTLLGVSFQDDVMIEALKQLGYQYNPKTAKVQIPSWRRRDITAWQDIAEDIARVIGYDKISASLNNEYVPMRPDTSEQSLEQSLIRDMCSLGFHQCVTFPMIDPDDFSKLGLPFSPDIHIENPLTPVESVMRPMVFPSLLKVLTHNYHRQEQNLSIFEIGTVFPKKGLEELRLSALMTGVSIQAHHKQSTEVAQGDFFYLKGLLQRLLQGLGIDDFSIEQCSESYLHPKEAFIIKSKEIVLGQFGTLHPMLMEKQRIDQTVSFFELSIPGLLNVNKKIKKYKVFSKFPSTRRDIAILADKALPYSDILSTLHSLAPKSCRNIQLFDHFESDSLGTDKKSLAFALYYQVLDRTLSDDEVNKVHSKLSQKLLEKLPIQIR